MIYIKLVTSIATVETKVLEAGAMSSNGSMEYGLRTKLNAMSSYKNNVVYQFCVGVRAAPKSIAKSC